MVPDALPPVREDPLVDGLAQSAFLTMQVLTRVGAGHDLSLTQLRALAVLRNRRLRMSDLADHLGLERSTMSGLITRAESRGLVRRAPGRGDGRSVEVTLTRAGADLADLVGAEVRAELAAFTTSLTEVEQRRLATLLLRVVGGQR